MANELLTGAQVSQHRLIAGKFYSDMGTVFMAFTLQLTFFLLHTPAPDHMKLGSKINGQSPG